MDTSGVCVRTVRCGHKWGVCEDCEVWTQVGCVCEDCEVWTQVGCV